MNQKSFIQTLEEVWTTGIKVFFESGKICSERALQAELYSLLKPYSEYDIWIEPKLKLIDSFLGGKVPDVIVTKNDVVIGMIELKYALLQGIDCTEDIKKLIGFSEFQDQKLYLKTNLKTGTWDEEHGFKINKDTCFVLAVISWEGTEALTEDVWTHHVKKPDDRFAHLIGKIDYNGQIEFMKQTYKEML